jgi:hypothetical protein
MLNRADATKTLLTVALLAILLALSWSADFYNSSMVDAFMAMAMALVIPWTMVIATISVSSLLMHRLQNAVSVGRPEAADARKAEASVPPDAALESEAALRRESLCLSENR